MLVHRSTETEVYKIEEKCVFFFVGVWEYPQRSRSGGFSFFYAADGGGGALVRWFS